MMEVNMDIEMKEKELLKEKEELLFKLDVAGDGDYNVILTRILDIDLELNLFSDKK